MLHIRLLFCAIPPPPESLKMAFVRIMMYEVNFSTSTTTFRQNAVEHVTLF